MKLSIICNTFNHYQATREYLPKMINSCGVTDFELLVNDNGSRDGCDRWLKTWEPEFPHKFTFKESNIGNPQALNEMLSSCTGEYIAKIDPDFIMPKDWAQKAIDLIEALPGTGLVGFYWARGLTHPDLQKGEIRENPIHFVPKKVFGCWVFHRSLVDKVGCFYDKWKYGNWDSEFQDRLTKAGYTNIYHREDAVHMGVDTPAERRLKNLQRKPQYDTPSDHYTDSPFFNHEQFSAISRNIISERVS